MEFAIQLIIILICLFYGAKKGGIALGLLGGIREFIGNGTLWDVKVTPAAYPGISFFTQPAGAFITLGTLIAAVTAIKTFAAKRKGADK